MKILVTGRLGQVGSYLAKRFSDSHEVTVLANYSNNLNGIELPSDIKIIKEDVRDRRKVDELVGKVDIITKSGSQGTVYCQVVDNLNMIFNEAKDNYLIIKDVKLPDNSTLSVYKNKGIL